MLREFLCFLLLAFATYAPSRAAVLDEIAPASVVCVGNGAPAEEREAASLIFRALRERSDSAQLLSDEQVLATPVSVSGKWHVIAVGRPTTNSVLLRYPSYWALDRELRYAPLGYMPAAPFTETRGFYVGGFGYFFAGRNVGFVEFDRSPFYSAMLFSLTEEEKFSQESAPPLRFLIRITGSTPNGVLLGAKRLVETRMVYGLAIGPPRWPRSHDIWNLDDENIKPDPPDWIPKGQYSRVGQQGRKMNLSFLGWLMADRTMYAGFLELTGCKPLQMWRAKYATEVGLLDFHRSPHHRASSNELLIVKFRHTEEVAKALKALGGNVPVKILGQTCYTTDRELGKGSGNSKTEEPDTRPFGIGTASPTHMLPTTIGGVPYLILANFDRSHAGMAMEAVIRSLPSEQ